MSSAWHELVSFLEKNTAEALDDQQLHKIETAVFYAGQYASAPSSSELRFRRFSHFGAA